MREVASLLKALSDEVRLEMLWLLWNHRELCVCDLMEALGITQSKASRHLATLRHAGLVRDRREATWSYYSLRPVASPQQGALLEALRAWLASSSGADRSLRAVRAWLGRKERGAECAVGCGRGGSSNKGTRGAKRVREGTQHGK
jgi:DNA-binding transcriptional ArsR family regulator